jgi:hypothetical protein
MLIYYPPVKKTGTFSDGQGKEETVAIYRAETVPFYPMGMIQYFVNGMDPNKKGGKHLPNTVSTVLIKNSLNRNTILQFKFQIKRLFYQYQVLL